MQSKENIDLQLFAEGGANGGSSPVAGGEGGTPPATEGAVGATTAPEKRSFEDLLSDPEYKTAYDQRVKAAIDRRFKTAKASEDAMAKISPALEMLHKHYKTEGDLDALSKAVYDDDRYYEARAEANGVSTATQKAMDAKDRELARYREDEAAREKQRQNNELFAHWASEEKALQAVYPGFDLKKEMGNQTFTRMLAAGVPMRTVYEGIHHDEIMTGAMRYAVADTKEKVADAVRSGSMRPTENGLAAPAAVEQRFDPRRLDRKQRQDLRNRVARGEKIVF